jgi:hypothetical protein
MIKSRDDLTMLSGFNILGSDGPRITNCVLCGGEGKRDGDIDHSRACVLAASRVTHVKITGVHCRVKEAKPKVSLPPVRWRERLRLCLLRR